MNQGFRQKYLLSPSIKELSWSLVKTGLITFAILYIIAYFLVVVSGISIHWFTEPITSFSKLNIAFLFMMTFYMALSYAVIFYRVAYDAIHKKKQLHKSNT